MWILIRWLHQKPADQDLQCFHNGINLCSAGQGLNSRVKLLCCTDAIFAAAQQSCSRPAVRALAKLCNLVSEGDLTVSIKMYQNII